MNYGRRPDFDWRDEKFKDDDGNSCHDYALVHASGRILAKISVPARSWDYYYQVFFFVAAAKRHALSDCDEGVGDLRFIDLESAVEYAELLLEDFGQEQVDEQKFRRVPRAVRAIAAVGAIVSVLCRSGRRRKTDSPASPAVMPEQT